VSAFADFVEGIELVDHHVHGPFRADGDEARFQNALNEGNSAQLRDPSQSYETQLGFAIRRWCAELLDLPRHANPAEYWGRRAELGEVEVGRRMTRAAGVSDWLVDTGFRATDYLDPAGLAELSGGAAHEIVRLEVLAEEIIARIADPADFASEFGAKLHDLSLSAVGAKSVLAYRGGFAQDLGKPTPSAVAEAARRWSGGNHRRLNDVTLIAHGIHAALELGMPLQFHVGFGDRDLDLEKANPALLMGFLRSVEHGGTPILLLHCYPYEREAGYLAQAFENVYLDVGLATNFTGARSAALLARSFELAPFSKILYSSDAYGPSELHYLGARLWRNSVTQVLGGWIDDDQWSESDARKVVQLVARDNARRVYELP
jgi:predicted TIM-barrel fold metal-dependent hydrolase